MTEDDIFPDNQAHIDFIMGMLNKACYANDNEVAGEIIGLCLNNPEKCVAHPGTPLAVLIGTMHHPNFRDFESRKRLVLMLGDRWLAAFGEERTSKLLRGIRK